MKYSDKQIDKLLKGIYDGTITPEDLPIDLYNAISKYLGSGLYDINGTISKGLIKELSTNLEYFSAAKTYWFTKETSLLTENEELKSFNDFKEEALKLYDQYNINWLEAEYSTTIGQAQMCERWEQIDEQKEKLPFLRYSAIEDANTSEICAPLDGITLPVDDPFWDSNSPLNHFNCRCTLEQLDEFDAVVTTGSKAEKASVDSEELKQPVFNSNPYRDKEIFNKEHPYFDLPKEGKESILKLVDDGE